MIDVLLMIHVISGVVVLLSGLLVLLLKKGSHLHRRLGWCYAFFMLIIFITSTSVSLYKNNLFLLLIGFFSFYLVHSGITVNRFRKEGRVYFRNKLFTVFYTLCFLAMLVLALLGWIKGNLALGMILGVFGLIGMELVRHEILYFLLERKMQKNELIREHIGRLTGSYIAAVTAFAVNNLHFLPTAAIWLTPTLLGFLLIGYFSKPYKKGLH